MECEGQDNANGETRHTPEERHDAIETREEDGDNDKGYESTDAQCNFGEAAVEAGHAVHAGRRREGAGVEAKEDFKGADNWARVQRDFGEGDDGDADCDEDGCAWGVSFCQEDVAGDFVAHVVAEHEDAGAGHARVDDVGEDVRDVDATAVFIGVAHVAVDVGEDGVPAPGGHEEAEGERDGEPVAGEEVLGRGFADGARGVGLDEAVNPDGDGDWRMLGVS
jgi:hypothetical protein